MNAQTAAPLTPRRNPQEARIADYQAKIAAYRTDILLLVVVSDRIRQETRLFQREYNARVGWLYVELDKLELSIKESLYKARLLEHGWIQSAEQAEKRVREAFRMERQRVETYERTTRGAETEGEGQETRDARQQTGGETRNAGSKKNASTEKQTVRALYLKLAKQYHPDKAADDETRLRREQLMSLINRAYEENDFEMLEHFELTLAQGEVPEELSTNEQERRLYRDYLRLHQTVVTLRQEVERLKNNETYQLREKVVEARERGEDLLGALHQDICAKIEAAKQRFMAVREQFARFMDTHGMGR